MRCIWCFQVPFFSTHVSTGWSAGVALPQMLFHVSISSEDVPCFCQNRRSIFIRVGSVHSFILVSNDELRVRFSKQEIRCTFWSFKNPSRRWEEQRSMPDGVNFTGFPFHMWMKIRFLKALSKSEFLNLKRFRPKRKALLVESNWK